MSKAKLCSKEVSSFIGSDSPFLEVIFIRYDDSPTSGVVRCKSGSNTYRFEMLTRDIDGRYDRQSWDQGEEIRIFSLAPLSTKSYELFAGILSQPESQRKIAEDEIYFAEVYSILEKAGPPELVIATHGINTKIIGAKEVTLRDNVSVQDWFFFLGFTDSTRDNL